MMSASKNDIIEEVKKYGGYFMAYKVNFKDVETVGLETSPVADSLAGLRANEARYFGISINLSISHIQLMKKPTKSLCLRKFYLKNVI